jgi:hypothetical protein
VPIQTQVQVPIIQTVQKAVDVPQIEYEDQVVEVPIQKQVQVPVVQKVQKHIEVPQVQVEDQVVQVPIERQVHVPAGATEDGFAGSGPSACVHLAALAAL